MARLLGFAPRIDRDVDHELSLTVNVLNSEIADIKIILPKRFRDDRGWFEEMYRRDILADAGVNDVFVQDNISFSAHKGTVRGLHFQIPPFAQAKLVRVLAGSVLDVAVDLRHASPTYGKHVSVKLDAAKGQLIYLPAGFAHGFCTLENNTLVAYKVTAHYSGVHERNLAWNDPALGIEWPVTAGEAVLSPKDRAALPLGELQPGSRFDEPAAAGASC